MNTYLTIRDMDDKKNADGGRFFINEHNADTGETVGDATAGLKNFDMGWGQHTYQQRRQARRAVKALATKLGILYRQDKEYTTYREADQRVVAPVTV